MIKPLARVRTKRKAVQRLLTELETQVAPGQPVEATVMHAQVPEEMEGLEAEIRRRFRCRRVIAGEVGAVVGIHAGPGVLGASICPVA